MTRAACNVSRARAQSLLLRHHYLYVSRTRKPTLPATRDNVQGGVGLLALGKALDSVRGALEVVGAGATGEEAAEDWLNDGAEDDDCASVVWSEIKGHV